MNARFSILAATAASSIIVGLSSAAAQESRTALVVPRSETSLLIDGFAGGFIDIFAGSERCGRLVFDDVAMVNASGDHRAWLDGDGVPQACRTTGTTLKFVDGHGRDLLANVRVEAGKENVLLNLSAPQEGYTGGPGSGILPPNTGSGLETPGREGTVPSPAVWAIGAGFVSALVGLGAIRIRRGTQSSRRGA